MQQMIKLAPKEKLVNIFGPLAVREVPSFHCDFPKHFGWPAAVKAAKAAELLEAAYSNAVDAPWMLNHIIKTGDFQFEFEDWQKRFHFGGLGLERMKLVFQEGREFRPGDVLDMEFCNKDFRMEYDFRVRNSFANCLNRMEVMQQGTVHVAVGFNDLGTLLTGDFRPSPEHQGPLRFIGYEMNAFNVAKTQIVTRLLKDPEVPLGVVLQIWFSSAWTSAAETAFRSAAAACGKATKDLEVNAYLSHWISAPPVPLTQARDMWLEYHDAGRDWVPIGCMARHKDRMALCHYLLTGDVTTGETPSHGSLAMWSVPSGSPPLQKGETAFNAISIVDLLKEVGQDTGPNVHAALEAVLMRRLQRLRDLLTRGEVQVELRVGKLSLENAALLSEIAALQPWTMSWSNVLDHMHLRDFHAVARVCSARGDTIHYGYSMNWITGVFGTCIMDFPQEVRGELIDAASQGIVQMGSMSLGGVPRADMLLVLPPHDTPLNYTGFVLSTPHCEKWADYFCSPAFGKPAPKLAQAHILDCFCPLHQSSCSMSLTWTYDADIKFQKLQA